MNKFFYLILFILFVGGFLYSYRIYQSRLFETPEKNPATLEKYSDITSDQLKRMLEAKDFYFVNVHIPYEGEIEKTDAFIPYDQINNNLNKLPEDKEAKIVLYCKTGRMSALAARRLVELGYTNVKNLSFGMHDWQSKGYSLTFDP